MRRIGDVWHEIRSFDNLRRSTLRAARGKRAEVLDRLEPTCLALQRALDSGAWSRGPTTSFRIHDPKSREITVAPFEDRVVHHALIGPLEPKFERRMVFDSYACRRGKGAHRALDRAQRFTRRFEYVLKLDVENFFASLDHGTVCETMRRLIKDRTTLELINTIVRAPSGSHRGLPIGSLTSQWFANLTLDRVDHLVREELRVPGYVRYMDDMLLFADDKARLHDYHAAVAAYLRDVLALRLKPRATRLAPTHHGVPFLGVQVYPRLRRLRPENLRRSRWRLRFRRWQFERGVLTAERYIDCVRSTLAHLGHPQMRGVRRALSASHDFEL